MKHIQYGGGVAERSVLRAMTRGFLCRCPNCGEGRLFGRFLKVSDRCEVCAEDYHHHRADDLPAYLVVFIVGHVVVGAFMSVEAWADLALWQHLAIWAPLTAVACVAMLQPVKGSVVGLQWALRMHGFGGTEDSVEEIGD